MNNPDYQRLREQAWRRKLTLAELADLRAARPESAVEMELEAALSDALERLPEAPVPSNFTTRVLQGIEREVIPSAPGARDWSWIWRVFAPRAAVAMLVIGSGVFAIHQHQVQQRAGMVESLKTVAAVQSLPSSQALQDFDVIQKLDSNPAADKELIALLQ